MKKLLPGLGLLLACIIALVIVFFAAAQRAGSNMAAESKAYVDRVVPLIAGSWRTYDLLEHASPELLKVAPPDKVDEMFKVAEEKLGKLKAYQGSKKDSLISLASPAGTVTAAYTAQAVFEKAKGTVRIQVIKQGKDWKVLTFYVDSPALAP